MTGTANNRRVAIQVLRIVLGLSFLTIGVLKVSGALHAAQLFDQLGWAPWLRYGTGILDVVGALLVFARRGTFYGAVLLASTVEVTTVLTSTHQLQQGILAPLVLTLAAAMLAALTAPRGSGAMRKRATRATGAVRPQLQLQ
jgi:putative oxidoreductase